MARINGGPLERSDEWNRDINPEFMTLYRGHVLDDVIMKCVWI